MSRMASPKMVENINAIVSRAKDGERVLDLAVEYGVTASSIYHFLSRRAIKTKRKRVALRGSFVCQGCGRTVLGNESETRMRKFCSNLCQGQKLITHGLSSVGYYRGTLNGERDHLHRIIAAHALGRKLKRTEVVHHLNGDKTDNRNSNLLICSGSYHRELHARMSRLYQQEHFQGKS